MKLPRKVQIIRGQFDLAAFISVLFLLLMFLLLHSSFVFMPGVPIQLPEVAGVTGVTNATITVAMDRHGQIYFENQISSEGRLKEQLAANVAKSSAPLTLIIQADRAVTYEALVRLSLLAREAGMKEALLAVRPQARLNAIPASVQ